MRLLPSIGVFLDRDGVLVDEDGYLADPARLAIFPEAREALTLLEAKGCRILVVTNQSGVARGLLSEEILGRIHEEMRARLDHLIDAVYYCPHHPTEGEPPYRQVCHCRKPEPGLVERALADWSLDPRRCYLVGDSDRDILCGQSLGLTTVRLERKTRGQDSALPRASYTASNLLDAVRWILLDLKRPRPQTGAASP